MWLVGGSVYAVDWAIRLCHRGPRGAQRDRQGRAGLRRRPQAPGRRAALDRAKYPTFMFPTTWKSRARRRQAAPEPRGPPAAPRPSARARARLRTQWRPLPQRLVDVRQLRRQLRAGEHRSHPEHWTHDRLLRIPHHPHPGVRPDRSSGPTLRPVPRRACRPVGHPAHAYRRRDQRCDLTVRYCSAVASWYGPGLYGNRVACPPPRAHARHDRRGPQDAPLRHLVTFRYRGRVRRARVIDRGPFIAYRDFDPTNGLRLSLRFPQPSSRGHDTIEYRLPRTPLSSPHHQRSKTVSVHKLRRMGAPARPGTPSRLVLDYVENIEDAVRERMPMPENDREAKAQIRGLETLQGHLDLHGLPPGPLRRPRREGRPVPVVGRRHELARSHMSDEPTMTPRRSTPGSRDPRGARQHARQSPRRRGEGHVIRAVIVYEYDPTPHDDSGPTPGVPLDRRYHGRRLPGLLETARTLLRPGWLSNTPTAVTVTTTPREGCREQYQPSDQGEPNARTGPRPTRRRACRRRTGA